MLTPIQEKVLLDELEALKNMSTGEIQAYTNRVRDMLISGEADPNQRMALQAALVQGEAMLVARAGFDPYSDGSAEFDQALADRLPEVTEGVRRLWGDDIADEMTALPGKLEAEAKERELAEAHLVAEAAQKITQMMEAQAQAEQAQEAELAAAQAAEVSKAQA